MFAANRAMSDSNSDPIECAVTPWYYRRMGAMTAMLLGFAGWFLYDGLVGWPNKNKVFREHERFEAIMKEREEFLSDGESTEEAWIAHAKTQKDDLLGAYPLEDNWTSYTARLDRSDSKPKKFYDAEKIRKQFYWSGGCAAVGAVVLIIMLINRRRKLTADGASFTTPNGRKVPFSQVTRIDRRKWNKGLAYVFYGESSENARKAVIDDLKFAGADQILQRVEACAPAGVPILERVEREEEEASSDLSAATETSPSAEPGAREEDPRT